MGPPLGSFQKAHGKVQKSCNVIGGARASTHILSMKILENKFKIPEKLIRNIFYEINTIAIRTVMSIILHKRILGSGEPLPNRCTTALNSKNEGRDI